MKNRNNLVGILAFILGAGCGFYGGYRFGMSKVQKVADEQVESTKKSLKKYYESKNAFKEQETTSEETPEPKFTREDLGFDEKVETAVKSIPMIQKEVEPPQEEIRFQRPPETLQPNGVNDVLDRHSIKDMPPTAIDTPDGYYDPDDKSAPPYLLRREDFGEFDDWDTLELILWKDGTVTMDDSLCEQVSPTLLMRLLPDNWPTLFNWDKNGKYFDEIFFRNNKERKDIQIIKDNREYKEWLEEVFPGRAEEEFG